METSNDFVCRAHRLNDRVLLFFFKAVVLPCTTSFTMQTPEGDLVDRNMSYFYWIIYK
jgi:hypothetical protein